MLRNKPSRIYVDALTSPHSVIGILEQEDVRSISDITLADIRDIDGVRHVTTYVALRGTS